ncbi:RagB/SusD family nutrient uptake outer membrane protein [Bacteroides sp. 519]|uniref:RagB/SusD family nutrient uptake outer membrane protein n=1 Tax=Bacteroides sp. 519 TaxID=2302937 RepID=UPI0013D3D610|nr:RagB/SusD family nutrient uptake outer membrane protein [Bacteroides sp. 519]NDV60666.1 RagB/SusD family nutrient uptake outer membrane protein [Bacteroides sp. 519]
MKTLKYLSLLLVLLLGVASCDFLDVVPDEKPTEDDAFEDVNAAERFLYSCYSYLPNSRAGANSLDFMTGDEVITAFEHETFARFPKGNFSASSTVISYWNTFFQGLKQCYILINNIDKVPNLPGVTKNDYIAQVNFLIGYYHFLLVRCYGPVILIKEEPSPGTSPSDYLGRTSYDECVTFICEKFDAAAADLPNERPQRNYGLATKPAALALKAKMLLYAASPLFNGNSSFFNNFKDVDGNPLMPLAYDANKWKLAKDAYKTAIDAAKAAGHELLTEIGDPDINRLKYPTDPTERLLRFNIIEAGNKEILWADARDEGAYGLQNKSMPRAHGTTYPWNGVSPTWSMLSRFYTENGLPYDEDPAYKDNNKFEIVNLTDEHVDVAKPGEKTILFNLGREPRYYAWVAFHGGYYEVRSAASNGAYDKYPEFDANGRLVCNFLKSGICGVGEQTNDFSPGGYLNKKGVHAGNEVKNAQAGPKEYPWPIIRMAELYLSYAEACVETDDLQTAREYLNKVRTRAGIPTVEESWSGVAELTKDKLREIVRQERQIEFYLENQNFWDMRRWLLAADAFNHKHQGLNIKGESIEDLAQLTEVTFERKFNSPAHYLLPIPSDDVNRNSKLVQNPGY